eukprot:61074-Prorocentrum_minimum.AAC.3
MSTSGLPARTGGRPREAILIWGVLVTVTVTVTVTRAGGSRSTLQTKTFSSAISRRRTSK